MSSDICDLVRGSDEREKLMFSDRSQKLLNSVFRFTPGHHVALLQPAISDLSVRGLFLFSSSTAQCYRWSLLSDLETRQEILERLK